MNNDVDRDPTEEECRRVALYHERKSRKKVYDMLIDEYPIIRSAGVVTYHGVTVDEDWPVKALISVIYMTDPARQNKPHRPI